MYEVHNWCTLFFSFTSGIKRWLSILLKSHQIIFWCPKTRNNCVPFCMWRGGYRGPSAAVVWSRTQVRTWTWMNGTQVRSEVRAVVGTRPNVQFGVQSRGKNKEPVRTGSNLPKPEKEIQAKKRSRHHYFSFQYWTTVTAYWHWQPPAVRWRK